MEPRSCRCRARRLGAARRGRRRRRRAPPPPPRRRRRRRCLRRAGRRRGGSFRRRGGGRAGRAAASVAENAVADARGADTALRRVARRAVRPHRRRRTRAVSGHARARQVAVVRPLARRRGARVDGAIWAISRRDARRCLGVVVRVSAATTGVAKLELRDRARITAKGRRLADARRRAIVLAVAARVAARTLTDVRGVVDADAATAAARILERRAGPGRRAGPKVARRAEAHGESPPRWRAFARPWRRIAPS